MTLDAISIKLCCTPTIRSQGIEEEPAKGIEKEWMTSELRVKPEEFGISEAKWIMYYFKEEEVIYFVKCYSK